MKLIIDDSRIIEYKISDKKTTEDVPFCTQRSDIYFERDKYTFVKVYDVAEGLMIDNVTSQDTDVFFFNTEYDTSSNTIAILDVEKEVRLDFTFTEGYRLRIIDEAKKETKTYFYKPDTFVSLENNGKYKNMVVKEIVFESSTPTGFEFTPMSYTYEGKIKYTQRVCYFKMPKQNVDIIIKYYPLDKSNFVNVKINLDNLRKYSYVDNRPDGANYNFMNYITKAQYSDDYDVGYSDKAIDEEKTYSFAKGSCIRLKLNLLKKVNLKILLNGKESGAELIINKHNVQAFIEREDGEEEINDIVYEYDLKHIELTESGTVTFEVI